MNNIKHITHRISQIFFVIALVFVTLIGVQPNGAAATSQTPNSRRVTAMVRQITIRRNALVKTVSSPTEPRNVVSTATEPVLPSEPVNVVLPANEPAQPRNVVSGGTEPITNPAKVRVQSGPRIEVVGAQITRK